MWWKCVTAAAVLVLFGLTGGPARAQSWRDFRDFDWERWARSGADLRDAPFAQFMGGGWGLRDGRGYSDRDRSGYRGYSDRDRSGYRGYSDRDRSGYRGYSDHRNWYGGPWGWSDSRDRRDRMDRPGSSQSADLERRLDRLQRELEDLRRELRRR